MVASSNIPKRPDEATHGPVCSVDDYGVTGKQLPKLIGDAIASLPNDSMPVGEEIAALELENSPVTADQVVVITNFQKFVDCQHFSDARQIDWLQRFARMFTIGAQFPIYVGGYRQDVIEATSSVRAWARVH